MPDYELPHANFIDVRHMRIAYYEFGDPGRPRIFFVHGNSGSALSWRKQFSSSALDAYHLIVFDLPGHGSSDPEPDLDYSLLALGHIMAETIGAITLGSPFAIVGVSLGTNIVAEACKWLVPTGIVLAGPTILGEGFGLDRVARPDVDLSPIFIENASIEAVVHYGQLTSISTKKEDLDYFITDYQNVKSGIRSKLYEGISEGKYSDEVLLLKGHTAPLLVFGADELVVHVNYLDNLAIFCYKQHIFKIPGASHLVHIDQPEAFNELLKNYLDDVFAS